MKIKKGQYVKLSGRKNYLIKAEKRKFSTEFGEFDLGKLIGKKFEEGKIRMEQRLKHRKKSI